MRLVKASSEGVEHVREGLGEARAELWGLDAYATLRENAGQLRESAWLLAKQESLGDSERLREALQAWMLGAAFRVALLSSSGDRLASTSDSKTLSRWRRGLTGVLREPSLRRSTSTGSRPNSR
jgi:hypothetical protein